MLERIDAVQQRALQLHNHASESPVQPEPLAQALVDLSLVLEELRTAHEQPTNS